jgi:hypothetical protein
MKEKVYDRLFFLLFTGDGVKSWSRCIIQNGVGLERKRGENK